MKQSILIFFGVMISFINCSCEIDESKKQTILKNADKSISVNTGCIFNTKGIQKASGINMDFHYPCDWEVSNSNQIGVVKQFGKDINNNSAVGASFEITKYSDIFTKSKIEEIRKKKVFEETTIELGGTIVSSSTIDIKGYTGIQIISTKKTASNYSMKSLKTYLFCQNKVIGIQYFSAATTTQLCQSLFEQKKNLFINLTTSMEILD